MQTVPILSKWAGYTDPSFYYKSSIVCNNSLFGLTQITFHFVSINHIKGNENTFILLVFSASKDLSAVSLPTEDPPIN